MAVILAELITPRNSDLPQPFQDMDVPTLSGCH